MHGGQNIPRIQWAPCVHWSHVSIALTGAGITGKSPNGECTRNPISGRSVATSSDTSFEDPLDIIFLLIYQLLSFSRRTSSYQKHGVSGKHIITVMLILMTEGSCSRNKQNLRQATCSRHRLSERDRHRQKLHSEHYGEDKQFQGWHGRMSSFSVRQFLNGDTASWKFWMSATIRDTILHPLCTS